MQDLISRQAAIDAVYKCSDIFAGDMPVMVVKADAYEALAQLPSADVAQVRHGRWIERYKSDAPPTLKERWICSWCGNVQTYGATDYCPNCGARMDGDDKSCDTCKHYDKGWDDAICDGCTKAHSNWERRNDE